MVAALPRHIRLKLEQTLAQWRQWNCDPPLSTAPTVQEVLGQGLSNFSVLVGAERRFVIRIDGINPTAHSLNRQGEWHSLMAAADAGLAPTPRYFNPELASLVCDYLPPDADQPLLIPEIAGLLRGIHQLPARHHRLDLRERILGYEKQLEHQGRPLPEAMVRYRQALAAVLSEVSERPQPVVLCHNDLLRANRVYSGGRPWAIDWEYCAMGSPWYDLAVVAAGDELSEENQANLLEAYLQRAATLPEKQLLLQYDSVYRYLELLWYLSTDHCALTETLLQQKLARLAETLEKR